MKLGQIVSHSPTFSENEQEPEYIDTVNYIFRIERVSKNTLSIVIFYLFQSTEYPYFLFGFRYIIYV